MENKKTTLIILIFIGAIVAIIFVSMFSLLKKSNSDVYTEYAEDVIEETGTEKEDKKKAGLGDSYAEISDYSVYGRYSYAGESVKKIVDFSISPKFDKDMNEYKYSDGEDIFNDVVLSICAVGNVRVGNLKEYENVSTKKINGLDWTIIKDYDEEENTFDNKLNIIQYTEYEENVFIVIEYKIDKNVEHKEYALMILDDLTNSIVKEGMEAPEPLEKDPDFVKFEQTYGDEDRVFNSIANIFGENGVGVRLIDGKTGSNVKRFYEFDLSDDFEDSLFYDYIATNSKGDSIDLQLYVASELSDEAEGDRLERGTEEINGITWNTIYIPKDKSEYFSNTVGCKYAKIGDLYFIVRYELEDKAEKDSNLMKKLNDIFETAKYVYVKNEI